MGVFTVQNPGIGIFQLTTAEEAFLTSFANLTYSNGQVLTIVAGSPAWATPSGGGGSGSGWELTGNAGTTPGTNFVGTTDAQDLVFKRNSTEYLRLKDFSGQHHFKFGAPGVISFINDADVEFFRTSGGATPQTSVKAGSTSLFLDTGYMSLTGADFVLNDAKEFQFYNVSNSNYVGFKAGTLSASTTWTLPTTDSTGTQALVSDGSGNLSWASIGGGGSPGGVADSIQTNDGAGGFFGNANLTYDGTKFFVGDSVGAYFEYDFAGSPFFNFMGTPTDRVLQSDLSAFATAVGNPDNLAGIGSGHYICVDPLASMTGYEGFHYGVNTGAAGTYDPYVLMDLYNITMFHDVKIQFDANTPPNTERQLAYDDTQKTLALFSGGMQQNAVQCVFTQDRTTTIADTTSPTSLLNTGWGSVTFPAGFFVEGKTIEFEVSGFMSSTGGPNITPAVKLGGVSLATATVASGNGTNIGFLAKGKITCKTTGSSGTFAVTGFFQENKTGGALIGLVNTTTASLNTTVSNAFDFTFAWGTASASNTITSQIVTLTVLN